MDTVPRAFLPGTGGAAAVLVEHAHGAGTPAATAWPLSGAVAFGLVAMVLTCWALADAGRLAAVYRPVQIAFAGGAAASVAVGLTRPPPWLLALLLVVVLALVWALAIRRFLLAGARGLA